MTEHPNLFHDLWDHLGFSCLALDPAGNVRHANRAACLQFGISAENQGTPFIDLLSEPDRPVATELFRSAIEKSESGEMETTYTDEEGARTTFVLIVSPIIEPNGRVLGISLCMRNISERKRLSKDLARARRMTSLGKMAGAVAHHFNNILGGMLTSIDYALPSDSPRELRKTLRLLSQSIGRATRITQQLAAFAESENAQHEQSTLDPIMTKFIAVLRPRCEKARVELIAKVEATPSGPLDEARIASVLEGIAQNSIDAMPDGGTLTVELSHDAENATISITDSGCGIPEDVLEHIFEPFFTTKGGLGGGDLDNIGLGLAAVHGLVAEMGGSIKAHSKVGKGTTVQLTLPLHRKTAPALADSTGHPDTPNA